MEMGPTLLKDAPTHSPLQNHFKQLEILFYFEIPLDSWKYNF